MPWARADSGAAADSLPTLQSVGYFRSVLRKPSKSIAIIYATLERWPGGILHGFPLQSFSRVLQQVVKLSIIRPALEGVRYPWCGPPPAREQNDALRIRLLEPGRCIEFDDARLGYARQAPIPTSYKGRLLGHHRVDLIVEDLVLVEIKAVERMNPVFEAQMLTYLRLTRKSLGLLINFNSRLLKDGIMRLIL